MSLLPSGNLLKCVSELQHNAEFAYNMIILIHCVVFLLLFLIDRKGGVGSGCDRPNFLKFSIIKQHSHHLTDCLVGHNAMTDLNLWIIYDDILLDI